MKHVATALQAIIARHGLQQGLIDHEVLARWPEIVGDLAQRTRPLEIRAGELWIYVEHPPLMQHVGFLAPRIMGRLNALVPGSSVKRLRFTLRT